MKENMIRKGFVIVIMVFFVGASVIPSLSVALDEFSFTKDVVFLDNEENGFEGIQFSFDDDSKPSMILDNILDQYQNETELYSRIPFGVLTPNNIVILAQSFKPTLSVLTKVDLLLKKTFSQKEITVSIKDSLESTDSLTSIQKPNSEIKNYPDWTTFNFDDIDVIPNQEYYIVCTTDANAILEIYAWHNTTIIIINICTI